jgi:hypothetical protein
VRNLALVPALAFALAGCASSTASSVRVGGPAVAPAVPDSLYVIVDGGLVAGATVGISAAAANAIAVIGIAGFLVVANDWRLIPPPAMREDRTINLQDCSKPIANWSANLRCASPEELRELERAKPE